MPSCPMHLADTMKFRPYLTEVLPPASALAQAHRLANVWHGAERCEIRRSSGCSLTRECAKTQRARRSMVRETNPRVLPPFSATWHREETDFSVEKLRRPRHFELVGKYSFRDIDADRNNFADDSDFSSDARMRDSQASRLRPFHKLQLYFRAHFCYA